MAITRVENLADPCRGLTFLALGLFLYVRSTIAQGKLSMPATMTELRNDRDALL